ncbi:hypothetical protein H5410_041400 [Solanum commersonii]|uniref:Uncharacterized protein n=1 Tax=Solanum commersonii TaxID=4109 RepID=A0A9J5XVD4_SOLCO|nr:hypothetical protein H5410_041400 [Solanum commersonii]
MKWCRLPKKSQEKKDRWQLFICGERNRGQQSIYCIRWRCYSQCEPTGKVIIPSCIHGFYNVFPLDSKWCVPEELFNVKTLPPLIDTKLGRKNKNVSRASMRISRAREGTNVQFERESDTREPQHFGQFSLNYYRITHDLI